MPLPSAGFMTAWLMGNSALGRMAEYGAPQLRRTVALVQNPATMATKRFD